MRPHSGTRAIKPIPSGFLPWFLLGIGAFAVILLMDSAPWLKEYPDNWVVPLSDAISAATDWFVDNFKWAFQAMSWAMNIPMQGVQALLQWLPWPVTISIFTLLALRTGGWKLALFTVIALGYMVVVGYWSESMNTLALVGVSVPISTVTGLFVGVLAFRSRRFNNIVQPTLDVMQTMPAFAYLVLLLFLFGFGPVVGMIAGVIYAAPPMVRNTILGLKQVPGDITESGIMSGCTPRQQFWQVEFPTALPQIMVGVNQATMASLHMVIIAAIIGGFDDIGWEVLSTMRKAQFGESLLAGLVIALLAMVLDRISAAAATRRVKDLKANETPLERHRFLLLALICIFGFFALSQVVPALVDYPESLVFYPAAAMNDVLNLAIINFGDFLESMKKLALFYFMFPIRNGLSTAINPFTWGFAVTPPMVWAYAIIAAGLSIWCYISGHWRAAVIVALGAVLLFFGTTGTPWPIFMAIVTLIAYQAGGNKIALLALGSMIFMLINGTWEYVMLSVYLCTVAVIVSVVLGGLIGIWAAHNDTVSNIVRPINDTLQTMPAFVLLIPVLMLFKVGEFTALLAIISYSIVPPIRYFEHGLRNVPQGIVEAAEQIGCTPRQVLFEVKLPMALPVIMLGVNQTILYGLAMLVIAALVGTQGLGQQIYLALTLADTGRGIVTGLSMAMIAMVADRILQAYSKKWQETLE